MMLTGARSSEAIEADQAAIEDALETYPKLQYTKTEVRQAGKILAGDIRFDDASALERKQAIIETFRIANNWREVHFVPIRSMRALVSRRARVLGLSVLPAARVKRISSIRKKLARPEGIHLDRINDIAGCRAVLDDIASVRTLVDAIRSDFPHTFTGREWDYINAPKPDGYRSHHMVFEYSGRGNKTHYNGLRVELQVRTRLQHSWATAVEAVGLYRNEDMKAGQGNKQWLRLFALMSAEFSETERCPVHAAMPSRNERIKEIRSLNRELNASGVLEQIKVATKYLQDYITPEKPEFFVIQYNVNHTVEVRSFNNELQAFSALKSIEAEIEQERIVANVVLVETDKMDMLKEAYPNYFGDVQLFVDNLALICDGRPAIEYALAKQQRVVPPPSEKPDRAIFGSRFRNKWYPTFREK